MSAKVSRRGLCLEIEAALAYGQQTGGTESGVLVIARGLKQTRCAACRTAG